MRLMTSAMAAIASIVVATSVLSPRAPSIEQLTAAGPSLEEFHTIGGVSKLPVQDVDDQSPMGRSGNQVHLPSRVIEPN
jgi:hypothetical protein